MLQQPQLTGAIIGIRDEREARQMTAGLGWQLTEDDLLSIERVLSFWE